MSPPAPRKLTLENYAEGVRAGDRTILGRAITLVESTSEAHRELADDLLEAILPHDRDTIRVGITGVPGVGKSTFIETLGTRLTAAGHRVAVLAVDPSSSLTGGSILGDKTRMPRLAADENAFIRPSPSSCTLGGVAHQTRESMLLCEAAGYDVILIETVGVGQSETVVEEMVDFFLVLMLAGAGDELQGIKRGILEIADLVAVNKADGENLRAAERARVEYAGALRLLRPRSEAWEARVLCISALEDQGLDELWAAVLEHRRLLEASGEREARRSEQQRRWMWQLVEEGVLRALRTHAGVREAARELEGEVLEGKVLPGVAARRIVERLGL
jgi:LAO/AO transport system kinase